MSLSLEMDYGLLSRLSKLKITREKLENLPAIPRTDEEYELQNLKDLRDSIIKESYKYNSTLKAYDIEEDASTSRAAPYVDILG